PSPRVRDQLEEILSQEDLAAAEREIERSGACQVVQERRELTRRQLRPPLDHPVAVDAVLVAAHGEVDVDGERDVPRHARPEQPVGRSQHRVAPSGLREEVALETLPADLPARECRGLEDLLAQDLRRLVRPLTALPCAPVPVALVTRLHGPSLRLPRVLKRLRYRHEPAGPDPPDEGPRGPPRRPPV